MTFDDDIEIEIPEEVFNPQEVQVQQVDNQVDTKAQNVSDDDTMEVDLEGAEAEQVTTAPDYSMLDGLLQKYGVQIQDEEKSLDFVDVLDKKLQEVQSRQLTELNNQTDGLIDWILQGNDPKDFIKVEQEFYFDKVGDKEFSSNEQLKEKALRENYKRKGFGDDKINKLIKTHRDLEEFEQEAKDAFKELKAEDAKTKEKIKLEKAEIAKRNEDMQRKLAQQVYEKVDSLKEVLPGFNLSERDKKEIKERINSREVVSKISSNPVEMEVRLALLDKLGAFDLDMNKFVSNIQSVGTKIVSNQLKSTPNSVISKNTNNKGNNQEKILQIMRGLK